MKATGFNTVRLGEFAWSRMEREEGKFDFTWLDRAIAAAERHGFMVVVGTPSAGPTAGMTEKYADTRSVDENGRRAAQDWKSKSMNSRHECATSWPDDA